MIQKILLAFIAMAFVFGCSKAPKEYDKNTVVDNDRPHERPKEEVSEDEMFSSLLEKAKTLSSANGEITSKDLLDFDPSSLQPGGEEFDKIVKFNSGQPMIYARDGEGGAAGIDFTTTYEESRKIATPRFPPDINGDAQYDENMIIRWRSSGVRTPAYFILFGAYVGEVQVPSPFSPFRLKHDFSNQFAANTQDGARAMARYFYNMFEGKESTFNCLDIGYCSIDWGNAQQERFVVGLPGMQFILSKDRFSLFAVIIQKVTPQGPLDSDLDIIKGQFLVDEKTFPKLASQVIAMGDTAESIDSKLEISTETSAGMDLFGRNYSGVFLGYKRTLFERENEQPLPTDTLKMIQVYRDYKRMLTINGAPVLIREFPNDVQIEVLQDGQEPQQVEGSRIIPFAVSLGLQRRNVRAFAEKIRDLLVAEYAKAYPQAMIVPHLSGTQQKKNIKEYTVFVIVYDKATKSGKFVQLAVSEENGHLNSFLIIEIGEKQNAVDPLIMNELLEPLGKTVVERPALDGCGQPAMQQLQADTPPVQGVERLSDSTFNSISGFTIGEIVRVKNWDLGRQQADITYQRGDQSYTARGTYLDRGVQNVAFDVTQKVKVQDQSFVDLGSLSVSLGLKLTCQTQDERIFKVVTVASAMKLGMINDLCGPLKLSFKVGTPAAEVLKTLQQTSCGYKPIYDTGDNGRLVQLYFPDDRIRLSFGDLELSGAMIYTPVNEVQ